MDLNILLSNNFLFCEIAVVIFATLRYIFYLKLRSLWVIIPYAVLLFLSFQYAMGNVGMGTPAGAAGGIGIAIAFSLMWALLTLLYVIFAVIIMFLKLNTNIAERKYVKLFAADVPLVLSIIAVAAVLLGFKFK